MNQSLSVTYSDNTNAGTATASASFAGDANHKSSSDSEGWYAWIEESFGRFKVGPLPSVLSVFGSFHERLQSFPGFGVVAHLDSECN